MNEPTPRYQLITSLHDAQTAFDEVLGLAGHTLRYFDVSVAQRGFNSPQRIEVIRHMLLADRSNRLQIVLHDIESLDREATRLIALARELSAQVEIHQTLDSARHAADPMLIADAHSVWHRLHASQSRVALYVHSPDEIAPRIERFEQIWAESEPAPGISSLGL